jgi:hypothetical protein
VDDDWALELVEEGAWQLDEGSAKGRVRELILFLLLLLLLSSLFFLLSSTCTDTELDISRATTYKEFLNLFFCAHGGLLEGKKTIHRQFDDSELSCLVAGSSRR